jgi:hypothetical protein
MGFPHCNINYRFPGDEGQLYLGISFNLRLFEPYFFFEIYDLILGVINPALAMVIEAGGKEGLSFIPDIDCVVEPRPDEV